MHARRLCGPERASVPLDRPAPGRARRIAAGKGVDAGHQGLGPPQSRQALCRCSTRIPSYVFFREVPAAAPGTLEAEIDGPIGTLGVPLLRERTLAVDPRSIPLGAPVFLATTQPLSTRPLQRLMLAQDTGGAIRGAVRADYFWGFGDEAGSAGGADEAGRADVAAVARERRAARRRLGLPAPLLPAGRRGRTSAPARRRRRAGSPSRTPRARTSRTCPDARSAAPAGGPPSAAGIGRASACRCRARACRASRRESRRRSRPAPPSTRTWSESRGSVPSTPAAGSANWSNRRPAAPALYRRGTVSRLWFMTSGGASPRTCERAVETAAEIRHQHLDLRGGRALAHRAYARDEMPRAAIAQIVAVHARDHHVARASARRSSWRGSRARPDRAAAAGRGPRRRTGSGACTRRP